MADVVSAQVAAEFVVARSERRVDQQLGVPGREVILRAVDGQGPASLFAPLAEAGSVVMQVPNVTAETVFVPGRVFRVTFAAVREEDEGS